MHIRGTLCPRLIAIRAAICSAVALLIGLLGTADPAAGSNKIDKGATDVSLKISASGKVAVVTYRVRGRMRVVTAWGALNARAPHRARPQARFRMVYGSRAAQTGSCAKYDGPPLPLLVAACKGPTGDYWALQSWPRDLPNYGVRPTREQARPDLRLSHWRGALPVFTVKQDWAYRGRFDHLYGSLAYEGRPMHGFRTTRFGAPLDRYGVLVYVDTLDSAYGRGWRRENSFVTHKPSGIFCYGFFPHGRYPSGRGVGYRATVVGPGVLPDLVWESRARGPYAPQLDAFANAEQRRWYSDRLCRPN